MANVLVVPASGSIIFDSQTAGSSTISPLSTAPRISYDNAGGINIQSYVTATSALDRFTVDGTNGRLFSVSDALTGSIFSVNDISGLPIIEVNSGVTDVITMGTYGTNALVVSGGNVAIGTATPGSAKLTVAGSVSSNGPIVLGRTPSTLTTGIIQVTEDTSGQLRPGILTSRNTDGSSPLFATYGSGGDGNTGQVSMKDVQISNKIIFRNTAVPLSTPFESFSGFIGVGTSTIDLALARDAADTLAQRRSTNPQEFRLYNTYTDASNYERGTLKWSLSTLRLATNAAGTGVTRGILINMGDDETNRPYVKLHAPANNQLDLYAGSGNSASTFTSGIYNYFDISSNTQNGLHQFRFGSASKVARFTIAADSIIFGKNYTSSLSSYVTVEAGGTNNNGTDFYFDSSEVTNFNGALNTRRSGNLTFRLGNGAQGWGSNVPKFEFITRTPTADFSGTVHPTLNLLTLQSNRATLSGNLVVSGNITSNTNYVVSVSLSADITANNGTDTPLIFPLIKADPSGWTSVSGSNTRITPTVPGYYNVSYMLAWRPGTSGSGNQNNIQIIKNGATVSLAQQPIHVSADVNTTQVATALVYMNGTTDYLTFQAYSSNAAQVIVGDSNWSKVELFKIN